MSAREISETSARENDERDAVCGQPNERSASDQACLKWLWRTLFAPDGSSAICPHCRAMRRFHRVSRRRAYACDTCGRHIYPMAGTFMENSRLGVATWFAGVSAMDAADYRLTAEALATQLGVNYKTALRMKQKLLKATRENSSDAALIQRIVRESSATGSSGSSSPAVGRSRHSRMRDTIRAGACRAFAAHGLPATRIADIAREAGVSTAAVRYYYKSKDEILLAALQWAMEQTERRIEDLRGEKSSTRRLRGVLELALPLEGRVHDEVLLWLEIWVRIRFHPELLTACVAMSDAYLSAVREAIEAGVRAGVFHPVAEPAVLAQWLVALADGLSFRSVVGYTNLHVRRVAEVVFDFSSRQLGITTDELLE